MGAAFLYGNGGGGGASLNYKVVGGTSAPSNPKENTIWVNTSTEITSHVFSATQPTGSAGMVWIQTSAASTIEFNALKKNTIQVYPISAKQYVSGAWVDKTAKSYQGGKWVEWIKYLYKNGDQCTDITGGWNGNVRTKITVDGSSSSNKNAHTSNLISLSGKTKLYVTVDTITKSLATTAYSWSVAVVLTKAKPSSTSLDANGVSSLGQLGLVGTHTPKTIELNISGIDEPVCVVIIGHKEGGAGTVTNIWAE